MNDIFNLLTVGRYYIDEQYYSGTYKYQVYCISFLCFGVSFKKLASLRSCLKTDDDTACLFFRILSPCQSHPVTSVCTNIEHYTIEKAESTCFQIFLHLIRCDFMSWMCVQINILIYIRLSRQLSFTFLFIPVYNNLLARLHIRNIMA